MKTFSKRALAVLLALMMCVGMLNLTAFAYDETGTGTGSSNGGNNQGTNQGSFGTGGSTKGNFQVKYVWTGLPEGAEVTVPECKNPGTRTGGWEVGTLVEIDTTFDETYEYVHQATGDKYTFSGWTNFTGEKDGELVEVTFTDGKVTSETPASTVTISGTWEKVEAPAPVKHNVTYKDGNETQGEPEEYGEGDTVTVRPAPAEQPNKEFVGWTDGTTVYDPEETFEMPDHDVTLTAKWMELQTVDAPTYGLLVDKVITSGEKVKNGGTVEYKVTITNNGTDTLQGLTVTDVMDSHLSLIFDTLKSSKEGTFTKTSTGYTWTMRDGFKNGDTVTLTYSATVSVSKDEVGGNEMTLPNNVAVEAYYITDKTSDYRANSGIMLMSMPDDGKVQVKVTVVGSAKATVTVDNHTDCGCGNDGCECPGDCECPEDCDCELCKPNGGEDEGGDPTDDPTDDPTEPEQPEPTQPEPTQPEPTQPEQPEPTDPVDPGEMEIPEEDPPLTDIPEEDPPLTDIPEEDPPLSDIPEEDPPLSDLPDLEIPEEEPPLSDIPDVDIPMADVPDTGDNSHVWGYFAMISGVGLAALVLTSKKREEIAE